MFEIFHTFVRTGGGVSDPSVEFSTLFFLTGSLTGMIDNCIGKAAGIFVCVNNFEGN